MSSACWACLRVVADGDRYHAKCLRELFGVSKVPAIDVELAKLHTLALAMVGHTSLSGIQRKISLRLAAEARTLQVAAEGGRFILKPQAQTFPALPQNEHVTMRIAQRARIVIPPCALIELKDGTLAYIVKRFDRVDGAKLLQEDFCQLAGQSPKDKYNSSAERCAKLVLKYATAPVVESHKLFRLLVVVWWTGNGDMHLKNFSLLRREDGNYRLSPAYDLLCTRLVIEDDHLALPVDGVDREVGRRRWLALAEQCRLPRPAAERVLGEVASAVDDAVALIAASLLDDEMKAAFAALIRGRGKALLGS